MKRLYKIRSKKGFTLVEVMLATAIMAMASMMIMNGFIALMNFASNSSVYSRVGASNYGRAAEKLSEFSTDAIDDHESRYTHLQDELDDNGQSRSFKIGATSALGSSRTINTVAWHMGWEGFLAGHAAGTISYDTNVVSGATGMNEYDETYLAVSNRTSFFYIPTRNHCPSCDKYGTIRYGHFGNGPDAWYCTNEDCDYHKTHTAIP